MADATGTAIGSFGFDNMVGKSVKYLEGFSERIGTHRFFASRTCSLARTFGSVQIESSQVVPGSLAGAFVEMAPGFHFCWLGKMVDGGTGLGKILNFAIHSPVVTPCFHDHYFHFFHSWV